MYDFTNRVNYNDLNRVSVMELESSLTSEDRDRINRMREYWNFYEGYHWETIPQGDKPQITENYCRKFVDKFVAFELGMGFNTVVPFEQQDVDNTETPINKFLDSVWEYNNKDTFCVELGQSKSITGDGWVQVRYEPQEEFDDAYNEFPEGRIRLTVIPSNIIFPVYNDHDKDDLLQVTIAYPVETYEKDGLFSKHKATKKIYKQIWTKDEVTTYMGNEELDTIPNPYGIIPFVQIKNFPLVGRNVGISDLEDIIPLNMELNLKKSDISEIIDYHSAPVTILFGAKVSSLEKGANKVWGGLPKDARVQNLELNSDLGAAVSYVDNLKTALHEIGCVPEGALGGSQSISNTSGVALQFVNMPLIERTRVKRMETTKGIKLINKMILHIALIEELIAKPEGIDNREFFTTDVTFPDTLPKDRLLELQQIQLEMEMGIESKQGAMSRLNKENPTVLMEQIEQDRLEAEQKMLEMQEKQGLIQLQLQMLGVQNQPQEQVETEEESDPQLNSGFTNGETPTETVRKEITGNNGMSKEIQ